MNHGQRLTTIALAIMASTHVSATTLNESSPEPQPINSPFIQDVKGTIVEDYSRETIQPSFFSMRMMSNADEQRGDWFNLSASYTRLQGVGSDIVYDYLMPPLMPQPGHRCRS